MSRKTTALEAFLTANPAVAVIRVTEALGSTPREQGAFMLVSPASTIGTIGGGQLEFLAIEQARKGLAIARAGHIDSASTLSIPLGPEIGQCCGGRVELEIAIADEAARQALIVEARAEADALPRIYLFGGGHVGHALAAALALLPVVVTVVETRADALDGITPDVETCLTAVPEDVVRTAPAGSAFVVLTHDHALDFLIVAETLRRGDARYVGMIGSGTKRATFGSWYLREAGGSAGDLDRLVCPIGGSALRDKRPSVIAALAAAEILVALSG